MGARVLTDAALAAALEQGKTTREIAAECGVTVSSVNRRRARLRLRATTLAVIASPEARLLVSEELDAIAMLQTCMQRLTLLSDAYHEWLLDPAAGAGPRYFIGPRATEIEVVYCEPGEAVKKKATLQQLLSRMEGQLDVQTVERKSADPRVELRNTVQTISTTVGQMMTLAAMLADMKAMQMLRDSILEELRQADADVAQRIVQRLRYRLVVSGTPTGSGTLDEPGRPGQ